ncbi:MAG TPA: NADH:ubiquinone oxidoreductase subunit NDUFA12 [Acetobacteraceae bacterium]|nr:NADH:ubiquinone oxidoreductase subunit NDUFA12 [Acetobacteraceae bacterium]
MDIGTRLTILLRGRLIGTDAIGNRYYLEKSKSPGRLRARRWVAYAGEKEASAVPAEWHAWLHYTTDAPIPVADRHPWQKPHLPNATGTPYGYRPSGHDYRGGRRDAADGDYEPWSPDA